VHERLEVVAGLEFDGLDAAGHGLVGQVEALRFATTRARVHEQHRLSGASGGRQRRMGTERRARRRDGKHEASEHQHRAQQTIGDQKHEPRRRERQGGTHAGYTGDPAVQDPEPCCRAGRESTRENDQAARELDDDYHYGEPQRCRREQQRSVRREPVGRHDTVGISVDRAARPLAMRYAPSTPNTITMMPLWRRLRADGARARGRWRGGAGGGGGRAGGAGRPCGDAVLAPVLTGGFGADYTFEATGNVRVMRQAVESAHGLVESGSGASDSLT
jgi:hypothetical protein